jgi:hypothetical protein
MSFIIAKGAPVYHEFRVGLFTWCGNPTPSDQHMHQKNHKLVDLAPGGFRLCKNCQRVKNKPELSVESRRKIDAWVAA